MTDQQSADQQAFEMFASLYPAEAYDQDPERFLDFAERHTGISREALDAAMKSEDWHYKPPKEEV